jgi:septal ring factor EnvC (AmiA/AmiB activator)
MYRSHSATSRLECENAPQEQVKFDDTVWQVCYLCVRVIIIHVCSLKVLAWCLRSSRELSKDLELTEKRLKSTKELLESMKERLESMEERLKLKDKQLRAKDQQIATTERRSFDTFIQTREVRQALIDVVRKRDPPVLKWGEQSVSL